METTDPEPRKLADLERVIFRQAETITKLREALSFYADPIHYALIPTPDGHAREVKVDNDKGSRARAALSA